MWKLKISYDFVREKEKQKKEIQWMKWKCGCERSLGSRQCIALLRSNKSSNKSLWKVFIRSITNNDDDKRYKSRETLNNSRNRRKKIIKNVSRKIPKKARGRYDQVSPRFEFFSNECEILWNGSMKNPRDDVTPSAPLLCKHFCYI